jgi:uncharacterized protein
MVGERHPRNFESMARFIRRLFARSLRALTLAFIFIFCSWSYVHAIEPNWLDLKTVDLTLPHLSKEFEGYKIVQLTDIHADRWMTEEKIGQIVEEVNRQEPDLVVLTGDYVTKAAETYGPNLRAFRNLKAKDGSLAVLGNHDHWSDPKILVDILEEVGVTVLHNEVKSIGRPSSQLNIAGVGDVWSKDDDLTKVLRALPDQGASIMLAHEPDYADETSPTKRFDLQLSGHSHGGQVHIPFMKRVLPPLGKLYPAGQYQVGDMIQYTSRGIGVAGLRVRLNCRPEVTILRLHAPAA